MPTGIGCSKGSNSSLSLIFLQRILYCSEKLALHIQVAHIQRVLLDEGAPGLDFVSHEDGEDGVGVDVILDLDAEETALGGVHGGFPELGRIHLAETLVALNRNTLLGAVVKSSQRIFEQDVGGQGLALDQREAPR